MVRAMGQKAVYDWMTERELGQDPSPEAPYHVKLQEYWAGTGESRPKEASHRIRAHAPAEVEQGREQYWAPREQSPATDEVPVTTIEFDWNYQHAQVVSTPSGQYLLKGGRAALALQVGVSPQPLKVP
jgi:hypothetical protein